MFPWQKKKKIYIYIYIQKNHDIDFFGTIIYKS